MIRYGLLHMDIDLQEVGCVEDRRFRTYDMGAQDKDE